MKKPNICYIGFIIFISLIGCSDSTKLDESYEKVNCINVDGSIDQLRKNCEAHLDLVSKNEGKIEDIRMHLTLPYMNLIVSYASEGDINKTKELIQEYTKSIESTGHTFSSENEKKIVSFVIKFSQIEPQPKWFNADQFNLIIKQLSSENLIGEQGEEADPILHGNFENEPHK